MTLRDSSKAILLFLWKVLCFSLARVPSLCLDTAHLCFLEEKGATTMLYFHGVCCESNHHPSRLLEAVTRCPHGQDLQAVLGQRAGSWPGLQRTDLRTACILQRLCCRNSSEAPAYMAAPS